MNPLPLAGKPAPTLGTPVVEQKFHPKYECPSEPGCTHLRSSNVLRLFCVHRAVLKSASGFFRTMLSLPQAESNSAGNVEPIEMSESPEVLGALLSVAAGRGLDMGPMPTVEYILEVLSAAEKYEVDGVVSMVRCTVLSHRSPFQGLPFKLAEVSHRCGWTYEYCIALERTLSLKISERSLDPELRALDSAVLADIIKLRYQRIERFRELLLEMTDTESTPLVHPACVPICFCSGSGSLCKSLRTIPVDIPSRGTLSSPSLRWKTYLLQKIVHATHHVRGVVNWNPPNTNGCLCYVVFWNNSPDPKLCKRNPAAKLLHRLLTNGPRPKAETGSGTGGTKQTGQTKW